MLVGVGEQFGGQQLSRGGVLAEVMGVEYGAEGGAGDAGGAEVAGETQGVVPGRRYGGHGCLQSLRGAGRCRCGVVVVVVVVAVVDDLSVDVSADVSVVGMRYGMSCDAQ
ncbi:hypothetical protein STRIP9103_04064 [Streptomyces ipomoeae 91-03]|uniref:Uncharacterized protein n=1 Tax=Streptomyces ipomoeae 91-03 TaxID=698759 RepID=L1L1Y3_9ACTN|nr:hypothetical protein STRIP9103_04064 [Streptomyces ipomoeae 91-03]